MKKPIRLALVAHDRMKPAIVSLATEFADVLKECILCATGTTAERIADAVALTVEPLLSGPYGGDLQIGARLCGGSIDALIFLRDPMTAQPHEPDISALIRACDVHNVPCATNIATARMLLTHIRNMR